MKFTNQQTATILAALRYWQMNVAKEVTNEQNLVDSRWMIPGILLSHFDEDEPLTTGEIDELCMEINFDSAEDADDTPTEETPGMTPERFEQWCHGCPKCGSGDIQYEASVTVTEIGKIVFVDHFEGRPMPELNIPDGTQFERDGATIDTPALHCNQCGLTEQMTMEQCDTITFD